jgi:hypothetical protein
VVGAVAKQDQRTDHVNNQQHVTRGNHMLKKIALGGIFVLASAFSLSTVATAVTGNQAAAKTISAPKAPVPQGLCPGGRC